MPDSKYQLRYLPKYEDDLNEIIDYIVLDLKNPVSANSLVDKIELAIFERLHFPLSFEPYQSVKKRKHPYYRIYVDNFTIFYVVIGDMMEVRRILYSRRDMTQQIK